jgi:predicted acetyltransferase
MLHATSLVSITDESRPVVERLWQLYVHDLSEFRGTMPFDNGLFKAGRLPSYFGHPDRCGYLIHSGGYLAGFAFVSGLVSAPRMMAEFFVVRGARRRNVGRAAATEILRRHPGEWEIPFQEENPGAARFWRGVAAQVSGGSYRQESRPVPNKPEIPPDTWLMLTV